MPKHSDEREGPWECNAQPAARHRATIPEVSESSSADAARVLSLVQRFGRQSVSFQTLESGLCYWFCGADACVAYCDTGGEPSRIAEVVRGFLAAGAKAGRRVRFFHVGAAFLRTANLEGVQVGAEPLWDPREFVRTGPSHRSLREQLRRARSKGVRVRLVPGAALGDGDSALRRQCDALVERWLASRPMLAMKFLVLLEPFTFADERRYAVAERDGKVVAFAVAVPVPARRGFFIEDLIRGPAAPNGTVESLIHCLMGDFAAEGCDFASLGLAPLVGDVGWGLRLVRRLSARLYHFEGVRAFKDKLHPQRWEPVYLGLPVRSVGALGMLDVLAAFAEGGLVRFGVQSLLHERSLVTLLLALGLLPWILLLALAPTQRWFPNSGVHWAWVAFDTLLAVLLFAQARRFRAGRARLLALLTTADASLTLMQMLWWNLWTAQSVLDWALVAGSCFGPVLASAFYLSIAQKSATRP
jgi:phosphatidylglycerol lysyltransferase